MPSPHGCVCVRCYDSGEGMSEPLLVSLVMCSYASSCSLLHVHVWFWDTGLAHKQLFSVSVLSGLDELSHFSDGSGPRLPYPVFLNDV